MTPVSTVPGLTILPKQKLTIDPHFNVVLHMMYGDADLYTDEILFKATPDGAPFDKWMRDYLRKDYGREATIYDAVAIADAIEGKYNEYFMKYSGAPDYEYKYAHPSMQTWFEDVSFEHEQCGGGYVRGWSVVYVDSDGVEYSVKFDKNEAHYKRVAEIRKGFFPVR